MASAFCFYLVGSKGNVSAFFWLQCVPSVSRAFQRRRFESFCGVLLSLSVVCVPKVTFREFFWLRFRMASARNQLGFCFFACAPQVALRLFVRLLRPFLVFRGFRRQRFESFSGYGFVAFLGRFGLGFRWCLGLFGSTADELHFCLCLGNGCVTAFCPSTAAFSCL